MKHIGEIIAETFPIGREAEIFNSNHKIVIPYDCYSDLCDHLGRIPTAEEQLQHYGALEVKDV